MVPKTFPKLYQLGPKIDRKSITILTSIFDASWRPTWLSKPTQNPSKIDRKSIKNRCRSWCFFKMLSKRVFSRIFVIFGPNLTSKRSQKVCQRTAVLRSFLALGASWVLGPRWPPDPSKSRFWSIFNRFWIYFGRFLDDVWQCLDDFWTISSRFLDGREYYFL